MRRPHTRDSAPSLTAEGTSSAGIPPSPEQAVMSVEECRRYLNGMALSDEEVKVVRDALYTLVRKVFDEVVPW